MRTILFITGLFFSASLFSQEEIEPVKRTISKVIIVKDTSDLKLPDENGAYSWPDVMAEFKGGQVKLQMFISRNTKYPQKALENKDEGKVYLAFLVDEKGRISNIKVERGVTPELDKESVRLINQMPKWKPAKVGGKKVKSIVRLPIIYVIK